MIGQKRFHLAAALAGALLLPLAAVAADAEPGVFCLPGTNTTMKLYGFVQLDTTFDFSGRDPNVEGNDWAIHIPNVPLDGSPEAEIKNNQLYLTARTSRFGIATHTPSKVGDIDVKLEADFNAANLESGQTFTNSVLFRLRHAYGTVSGSKGALLVGQTWSNFLDLPSYPDTVDFNGPGSIALIRQPMIKYTFKLGKAWSLAIAAENAPGTDGNDYDGGSLITPRLQTIPDFTANLSGGGKWGTASLRGVTMNHKRTDVDTASGPTTTIDKQGFGVAASGSINIKGDTLVLHGVYGSGIGRYIFNAGLSTGAYSLNAAGDGLDLWDAAAYHAGYTHNWNAAWRSNVVWSQTFILGNGQSAAGFAGVNKRMDQLFVNTFWSFAPTAAVGLEYGWGQRKTWDDQTGKQNRLTATFHYNFF